VFVFGFLYQFCFCFFLVLFSILAIARLFFLRKNDLTLPTNFLIAHYELQSTRCAPICDEAHRACRWPRAAHVDDGAQDRQALGSRRGQARGLCRRDAAPKAAIQPADEFIVSLGIVFVVGLRNIIVGHRPREGAQTTAAPGQAIAAVTWFWIFKKIKKIKKIFFLLLSLVHLRISRDDCGALDGRVAEKAALVVDEVPQDARAAAQMAARHNLCVLGSRVANRAQICALVSPRSFVALGALCARTRTIID
jgi:hypothetical protein